MWCSALRGYSLMATPLVAKASNSARRNKLSRIALSGNLSGTGTLTFAAPNTNTDRTLDLPDAAGTIQVSGNPISGTTGSFSGDLSFNSGYGSAAVAYGCRAWVNFNGTGTVAIRASGNVSSITDNGTGRYTVNFTSSMPDVNYVAVFSGNGTSDSFGSNRQLAMVRARATSTVQLQVINADGVEADTSYVGAAIFR
jgi:uncharacterized protein (AIM24 family)